MRRRASIPWLLVIALAAPARTVAQQPPAMGGETIEVMTGDEYKDLVRNLDLYFQVPSIREYWVVDARDDPEQPTLIQHRRRGQREQCARSQSFARWPLHEHEPNQTHVPSERRSRGGLQR
jgi:hypothetical protein